MNNILKLLTLSLLVTQCSRSEKSEANPPKIDEASSREKLADTTIIEGEIHKVIYGDYTFQYLIYPNGDTVHVLIQDRKGKVIENKGKYGSYYGAAINRKDGSQELKVILYTVSIDTLDKSVGLFEYKSQKDPNPEMTEGFRLSGNSDTITFKFPSYKTERILSLGVLFFDKRLSKEDSPQVFDFTFEPKLIKWAPKEYTDKDYFSYQEENNNR